MAKSKVAIEGNTISGTADAILNVFDKAYKKSEKENAKVTLKKAKIKDDLFLEVEYEEQARDGENTVKKSSTAPIHDDLKTAFRKLDEHLCRVCNQFNSDGDMDGFNVNCKGFTIGGSGDSEGVVLIGYRGFDSGKSLNLTSPFTKWEGDEYEYASELAAIIEDCKYEVMQYLFEGKHKPEAQQELDFPGDEI